MVSPMRPSSTSTVTSGLRALDCPNCGAAVQIRAAGRTVHVTCLSCKGIIDVSHPNVAKLIKLQDAKMKVEPAIQLGSRGVIQGIEYEHIGFMQRSDKSGHYRWHEYLLFNPWYGFVWLVENQGHWNLSKMVARLPKGTETELTFNGDAYRLFTKEPAKVTFVLGEFYWRIKSGDEAMGLDYISPPRMLSCEITGSGKNSDQSWSLAEYIDSEVVRKAFNISAKFPTPFGVAPNQPSRGAGAKQIWSIAGVAIAATVALQFYFMISASNIEAFRDTYETTLPMATPITTASFDLTGNPKNFEMQVSANVDNSWFELAWDLVNETTGETFDHELGVEYYSGYDSDGSWSEGSQKSSIIISDIPDGRYHLSMTGTGDRAQQKVWVRLTRGTTHLSNFIYTLIALLIYPLIAGGSSSSFEVKRWSNSDFSPYASNSGDDDDDDE